MSKIDLVKIAKDVVLEFKAEYDKKTNCEFVGYQLYASILENGDIQTSTRPNVLNEGKECFIIMTHSDLAVTNYYRWYVIKHIDSNGNVHDGYYSNGWHIEISSWGSFSNQVLSLNKEGKCMFSETQGPWENPWEEPVHKLWERFLIFKDCKSIDEIEYIAENFELKEKIIELDSKISALDFAKKRIEIQMKKYESLLDEISKLIKC